MSLTSIIRAVAFLVLALAGVDRVSASVPGACVNERLPADGRISACTAFIDAGMRSKLDTTRAYYGRALAWLAKDDHDRTIDDLTKAIAFAENPAFRGSLLGVRADSWRMKGEYDRAFADLSDGLELNPREPYTYLNRGNLLMDLGRSVEAIPDYQRAIRLKPDFATSYNNLANAYRGIGEFDKSIEQLNLAIKLDPKYAIAYATRGLSYRMKGDLDRALVDQNRAIEITPSALMYTLRGDTLRYLRQFDSAIASYRQALQALPDFVPAFTGLGLTYERMNKMIPARTAFEAASASRSLLRFTDVSKSALETAQARIAAIDSGQAEPEIVSPPRLAQNPTSIPTAAVAPAAPIATSQAAPSQAIPGKTERRVALVIGNSAYKYVPPLKNPPKDAEAVAASLRNIGFNSVILSENATREQLINDLKRFAGEAAKSDWAAVYYAGHGLEAGGVNFLIPVDAKLATDRDVQYEAVPLDQVLYAVDEAKKLKLVVLDACRDNPFLPAATGAPAAVSLSSASTGPTSSRSIGRGLAAVNVRGGTLVVFAAKNGQVALDGDGGNSPFATAVVKRISTPGVEINKLFRLVRDDVMEATAGRQEPYTYGSLPGKEDFFFVEKR
jgi:tetratricopeptide (TPR) repeat protein